MPPLFIPLSAIPVSTFSPGQYFQVSAFLSGQSRSPLTDVCNVWAGEATGMAIPPFRESSRLRVKVAILIYGGDS